MNLSQNTPTTKQIEIKLCICRNEQVNESADNFLFFFCAGDMDFYLLVVGIQIGCTISYRIYWNDDETVAITCFLCHHLLWQRLLTSVPFVKWLPFPVHNNPSKHSQTQRYDRKNETEDKNKNLHTDNRTNKHMHRKFISFIPLTKENCNSWMRCNSEGQNHFLYVKWSEVNAKRWFLISARNRLNR